MAIWHSSSWQNQWLIRFCTPLVVVCHDQAKVTHEAAIGTVNRKELESRLGRGLDEDEAVDLIICGLIR
ncbi:MAG TPA: SufD family Fe-S cluster assembly protein [Anaerolineales bacterium]|nr:SufD family Fe-S cluster assembly protein [Anaerolineales bacterium]